MYAKQVLIKSPVKEITEEPCKIGTTSQGSLMSFKLCYYQQRMEPRPSCILDCERQANTSQQAYACH
uniref:Uncharacterized protein n=1 Tax=Arundo donax TaxID=35708 RepID=A0A0A9D074_ARUDO